MAMPRLKQHKNGYWHYEFQFQGIRYAQSTKTKVKYVAQEVLNNLYTSLIRGGNDMVPASRSPKLFRFALEEFVELNKAGWGGDKGKTYIMHRTSMPHLIEFFGEMLITDINGKDLRRYQNHRKTQVTQFGKPPADRTINIELTSVRQLFVEHKLWNRLKEGSTFHMFSEEETMGKPLSKRELLMLFKIAGESRSEAFQTAIQVSVLSGVRRKELLNLQWKSVDFENRQFLVQRKTTKTRAGERFIPMLDAVEVLLEWKSKFPEAKPDHYVFPSQRYGHVKGGGYGIYKTLPTIPTKSFGVWKGAKKAAGIECRWHDLRHTFGTMIGKHATKADIKAMMGHVNDKMMDVYLHSFREDRIRVVEKAFEGWKEMFNTVKGPIQ
jgi:integrase